MMNWIRYGKIRIPLMFSFAGAVLGLLWRVLALFVFWVMVVVVLGGIPVAVVVFMVLGVLRLFGVL